MIVTLPAVRPPTNATEESLLDHALTLFAEKGYEAASVREIIEATGVTRPVLYYYCSSKEDLFQRLVHWKHDEAYRELGRIVEETKGCPHRLRAIIRGSFAFCAADPRVPKVMFQTTFGPTIPGISEFMAEVAKLRFLIVHQVMQEGLEAGELQGGDAASLSLIFCCIMDQHINVLARMPKPKKRLSPELADSLVDVFLNGLGAGKRKQVSLPPFVASPLL
ncbi:transcriptional regulator, TetR family [Pirellula staleyi DSM 6068]|uniref:Transcriptional regulator, TetR family n=1 Tax=Pirellula staleyi (strain ATCC 27377 / DSM 6068 / ICPB 4128) TaxID=530564 RepID=D2R688_PIRSD|nr:TetR/AcrR family transcriptional regulator [Pirellula staleyi]ADB15466.1 transcriptional regulator, TetR family [Pirellula staleyi DSM 6068]